MFLFWILLYFAFHFFLYKLQCSCNLCYSNICILLEIPFLYTSGNQKTWLNNMNSIWILIIFEALFNNGVYNAWIIMICVPLTLRYTKSTSCWNHQSATNKSIKVDFSKNIFVLCYMLCVCSFLFKL